VVKDGPALKAVMRWVELAGIVPRTALFRGIGAKGKVGAKRLHTSSIARAVKRFAGKDYSGHSMRAGFCTAAAKRHIPEWKMRLVTGHSAKSRQLEEVYIRPQSQIDDAVTNDIDL